MRGMARGYAAGDSRGPGWREFAGTLGQLQAGRQAGNGMACSRAKARLNWVSQGQRRGRCKVRRRAERVIRPTRAMDRTLAGYSTGEARTIGSSNTHPLTRSTGLWKQALARPVANWQASPRSWSMSALRVSSSGQWSLYTVVTTPGWMNC